MRGMKSRLSRDEESWLISGFLFGVVAVGFSGLIRLSYFPEYLALYSLGASEGIRAVIEQEMAPMPLADDHSLEIERFFASRFPGKELAELQFEGGRADSGILRRRERSSVPLFTSDEVVSRMAVSPNIHVDALWMTRLILAARVPSISSSTATAEHPGGLLLNDIESFCADIPNGSILIAVGASRQLSLASLAGQAIEAIAGGSGRLSGEIWTRWGTIHLSVQLPTLQELELSRVEYLRRESGSDEPLVEAPSENIGTLD